MLLNAENVTILVSEILELEIYKAPDHITEIHEWLVISKTLRSITLAIDSNLLIGTGDKKLKDGLRSKGLIEFYTA
ncbi:MAG: hypothetical protein HC842_02145 [Cytophagales bacterium]|nr:hypothetical protein [Cytophagales bacterium]